MFNHPRIWAVPPSTLSPCSLLEKRSHHDIHVYVQCVAVSYGRLFRFCILCARTFRQQRSCRAYLTGAGDWHSQRRNKVANIAKCVHVPDPADTFMAQLITHAFLRRRLQTEPTRSSMLQQRPWRIITHFDAPWKLLAWVVQP